MTAPRPRISMVVPVLQEAERIRPFLRSLRYDPPDELILVDGGSDDATVVMANRFVAELPIQVVVEERGLAAQLNHGSEIASGEVLFFPYVDTRLPDGWRHAIDAALADPRVAGGAFRLRLDGHQAWCRVVEWCANWRTRLGLGPFGDQAIFVRRHRFVEIGGFRDDDLLEDLGFARRLRAHAPFVLARDAVSTSTRRWLERGVVATTFHNWRYLLRHFLQPHDVELGRRYREYRVKSH